MAAPLSLKRRASDRDRLEERARAPAGLIRAHGWACLGFVVWGCTVYDAGLPNHLGAGLGGSGLGAGGEGATAGRDDGVSGSSGSSGSVSTNGGVGGLAGSGGTGGVSGGAGSGGSGESGAAGAAAGGEGGAMACVPETTAAFCKRVGKDCGTVDGTDNCGDPVKAAACGLCTGLKQCAGGGQDNVCGALTDPALGGIVTASSVGSVGESGDKAFDLDVNTKWYNGDSSGGTGWLAFQFPGATSHIVTSYSVTSANDVPTRDPTDWQLQGSNNGSTWITVDTRSMVVFANRHQTLPFTCANSTAYRWYRLLVTANAGETSLQLAELVLYGK